MPCILLLGARYGARQASGRSATYEEWREAVRCQKPVLVFVEVAEGEREPEQAAFVNEVQEWEGGRFRQSFRSPDELRDGVTRALADMTTSGLADEREILERALACVPDRDRGSFRGGARFVLVVAGGPRQQVLRPAQLEDQQLASDLQQMAMFDADAPLDRAAATRPRVEGNRLHIVQEHDEVIVQEDGTVVVSRSVVSRPESRAGSIPSIVEEVVRERVASACRFAHTVYGRIDPIQRVTDVVPVAVVIDAHHLPWQTAAEARADGGSVSMPMGRGEGGHATLSPAMVRRAALAHDSVRIAEDLTVLLRRQHL